MSIIKIIIIAFMAIGMILTVMSIGEQRKPITPTVAVISLIINALVIWGIWSL